jgi:hypothetical protein
MISTASSSISCATRQVANARRRWASSHRKTMGLQSQEVVVADDREVEADLLGEGDVAIRLLRACLLAHHSNAGFTHSKYPSTVAYTAGRAVG